MSYVNIENMGGCDQSQMKIKFKKKFKKVKSVPKSHNDDRDYWDPLTLRDYHVLQVLLILQGYQACYVFLACNDPCPHLSAPWDLVSPYNSSILIPTLNLAHLFLNNHFV